MEGSGVTVLVDARCVRRGRSGVGYSAEWMLRALDAQADPGGLHALTLEPEAWNPPLRATNLVKAGTDYESHPAGEWFMNFAVPRIARRLGCRVVWGPAFQIPWLPARAAKIVSIHDTLAFEHPEYLPSRFARYLRAVVRLSVARADAVLCHTNAAADSIRRLFPRAGDRIRVIPHAVDPLFRAGVTGRPSSLGEDDEPYVLALGGGDPRKNTELAVAATARLAQAGRARLRTVVVGGVSRQSDDSGVLRLPCVPRDELARLFRGAELFIFPTFAEGFGMPVLEAMACGCPVAASDTSVVREVADDAAVYFDPRDAVSAARAMSSILDSAELRGRLVAAGAQRTAAWSWDDAARKFLQLAGQLASLGPHGR
jgi:glycosyltransferase involved in cell wall biosynthesis